jgi:hypothetical protein
MTRDTPSVLTRVLTVEGQDGFSGATTALSLGFNTSMCSKLRSKWFLRTFLPPGEPCCAFQPARRADSLPIFVPERTYLAGKSPFARLRPISTTHDTLWFGLVAASLPSALLQAVTSAVDHQGPVRTECTMKTSVEH